MGCVKTGFNSRQPDQMFDLTSFIQTAGYLGIFGIVFAESGVLLGLFLPGDTLLFTSGFLASQDIFSYWSLVASVFLGAVLGDSFGYAFGKRVGPAIFKKEESFFFKKAYIAKAQAFYEKHGGKAIVLARFTPIVRTFAPVLAGVGNMNYGRFLFYNIIGGLAWTFSLTTLGFYLGNLIGNIDSIIIPLVLVIFILSLMPAIVPILKSRENRRKAIDEIKKLFRPRAKTKKAPEEELL